MRRPEIDLVDEDVDLGHGRHALVARPREPGALLEAAVADGASDAPYWAELWPSARSLAAHVAGLELVGQRAVELGCGLALVSVAAAHAGAEVLAVDHDADAVRIAALNGARAAGRVRALQADLCNAPTAVVDAAPFDLVLAADMLYEGPLAAAVAALIPRLTASAGLALVAFPWPGQGEPLAAALRSAGMHVTLGELGVPGQPAARTVGLLQARHRAREPRSDCNERFGYTRSRQAAP
jgi:predicted nicotinamide N-methyase